VLTTYATEHFGTRRGLAAHLSLFGGIGGGEAGTEGNLGGNADVGLRLDTSPTSGPFLRVGPNGFFYGNAALQLGLIEPLQSRLGYQTLDGDFLVEWGATLGMSFAGRYAAADAHRDLGRALQLGGYFVLRFAAFKLDANLMQLATTSAVQGNGVWLGRAAFCGYPRPLAVCVDLLAARGEGSTSAAARQAMRALYAGIGVGLTP
jgi:hypothetical protein